MTPTTPSPKRVPAEVFPVGDFIREEMEARGWSTRRLALAMGGTTADETRTNHCTVDLLLHVTESDDYLGEDEAQKLGRAFGVSGKIFLALDEAYRRSVR